MLVEHLGAVPRVDPSAWVAPSAVVSGDVEIGAETRVLHGAVLTAEGAPVRIGVRCVIMEHAVIRGPGGKARQFPVDIGDHVLIGPHTHLSGCSISRNSFIATGGIVFNGARVGEGSMIAANGVVHAGTVLPDGSIVPISHIAGGSPVRIYFPAHWPEIFELDFPQVVFGIDSEGKSRAELYQEMMDRYTQGLARHRADQPVTQGGPQPS
jgi:carbonic anhydrase/acetyltransferase-like protein (isoleucine patch superfamily)